MRLKLIRPIYNRLECKGYHGIVKYDDEAEIFHGDVLLAKGAVTFQGKTMEELKQSFHDSVNDYLIFCAESDLVPAPLYLHNLTE